jgi:hypothetical protein
MPLGLGDGFGKRRSSGARGNQVAEVRSRRPATCSRKCQRQGEVAYVQWSAAKQLSEEVLAFLSSNAQFLRSQKRGT